VSVAPPSGWPPPTEARLGDATVPLQPLAEDIAERYFDRYPEDLERYGDAGRAWEVHDTQHLLNWAIGDVGGFTDLEEQALWLAGILESRDFPVEHLAGNLELAADVVAEQLAGGAPVADRLRAAADAVRRRPPAAPR
jgi:hypothetical protein